MSAACTPLKVGDLITVEQHGHTYHDLKDPTKPQVFRVTAIQPNGNIDLKLVFGTQPPIHGPAGADWRER